jgi:Bacterial membrane protein YfhO
MAKTPSIASSIPLKMQSDQSGLMGRKFDRRDWGAIAGLIAIAVALFWRPLFTSDMLYFRDIFNYSYPHARLIQEICRSGHLPYWNPYLNWGQPLLANPNTLFFYPYTLAIILLPIRLAYPLHYVFHFSIAAAGTYLLARRWEQSRWAAFFAAGFFAFSGPVLSLGNFYNMAACVAWLPWALLFTDQAVTKRSMRPWVLLTLVFTLQFLAGEPMTLMATFGLAVVYALGRKGNLRKPFASANLYLLAGFFLVGISMITLAGVEFLPSLHLLSNSRRGQGLSFWQAGYWSFHPLLLLEIVLPDFFGPPLGQVEPWKLALNSGAVPLLLSYFLGFIPLFLALVGWAASRQPRRNFVAGAAAVFLLLALGRDTPLYAMLFWALPPLRLVRFPVKLLLPAFLMVAILAGWGFDSLRTSGEPQAAWRWKVRIPLMILFAGSLLVWLTSWLEPQWITTPASWVLVSANRTFTVPPDKPLAPAGVLAAMRNFLTMVRAQFPGLIGYSLGALAWLVALERGMKRARQATLWVALAGLVLLLHANYSINPTAPKGFYDYRPPVLAHFENSAQPYRFCELSHDRAASHHAPPLAEFVNFDSLPVAATFSGTLLGTFCEKILLYAGTMLTGYESASNSDVDASVSEPYYEFWGFEKTQVNDKARFDCLLGRANVKYLIARTREDNPATREVTEIFNGSPAPAYLYQDLCALPRAYAAGAALFVNRTDEAFGKLSDPSFDAAETVILSGPPPAASAGAEPGPTGSVTILDRQAGLVSLRAELDRPSYVVLLDRYDPNWHATLDGREVPILTANVMFRAVECPAGPHVIRFYYRQNGLAAGFALSLATFVLLATVYWRDPHVGS